MDIIEEGKRVFDLEINALEKTRDSLDETFADILGIITGCKGKLIITGMGKPGHIAAKLAATFSSLGTPSFYLHPAEAMHGDLGMVSEDDVIIAMSYSGESDEIVKILPNFKMIGAKIIALTGNADSSLARVADISMIFPKFEEACHLGLAPTSSTTVELCYGDALAITASGMKGFTASDFGKYHPAGALGKGLLMRVRDVMLLSDETAMVSANVTLKEAIVTMSRRGLSVVIAVENEKIQGILTDGDLRRLLEKNADIYSLNFRDVMTKSPTVVSIDEMAINALKVLKDNRWTSMPVVDEEDHYKGIVTIHSIVRSGIVVN